MSDWERVGKKYQRETPYGLITVSREPVYRYPSGRRAWNWIALDDQGRVWMSSPTGYAHAESAMLGVDRVLFIGEQRGETAPPEFMYEEIQGWERDRFRQL